MRWPLCICWRGFVLGESQNGISAVAKIINERMTAQIEGDFVVLPHWVEGERLVEDPQMAALAENHACDAERAGRPCRLRRRAF